MQSDPLSSSSRPAVNPAPPAGMDLQRIELREGLELILVNGTPEKTISLAMETKEVPFELSFHLSGHTRYRVEHRGGKIDFRGKPGIGIASAFPHAHATMEIGSDDPVRMVALHMTPDFLMNYLGPELERSGYAPFDEAFAKGAFPHCFKPRTADPAMTVAASQLLYCPYQGMGRKLFYESRALELIAMQLNASTPLARESGSTLFTPKELEGIRQARDHLSRNIESPPPLAKLARIAGMNHTKLNRGFKEVYGTTVFGYLRQFRLSRSRALIESGDMSLSEIAYATGFSSPSHFAKAFLGHFGIQPSLYLKQVLDRKTISLPSTPG